MPALSSELRRQLENVVIEARDVAEAAAWSALQKRAVDAAEPFPHFNAAEKDQRNRLRARGRQVGDLRWADKTQTIDQLVQELAYEFWHRMLFARFLAENHLLMHPDGVAVSLEECEELAPSAEPPAPNGFALAARYASTMLPQIFRTDDVLLEIEFAPEQRLALEKLLAGLPRPTFLADDSLGWVYQFWQTKKKDEVNKARDKIDGRTLPAVTQLFTEHYMVQFLLHNTIGGWWCARHNIKGPPGGAGVPAGQVTVEMEYLRWRDDGTPAAGTFDTWPKTLAEVTMLDPCCGSGHFLVSAFNLLVPLRMHDEKLTAHQACEAILRDNLFGLELDPRCTQIAAFALALAAWKYPGEDSQQLGYRPLPRLNIACSGQGVSGGKDEWLALANGDSRLRDGMDRLYDLFQQAPHLGSLIDPRREKGHLYQAGYAELQPLLVKALAKKAGDADLSAVGVAAQGIARAAELLGNRYTLVTTNVPYLGRNKQAEFLMSYCEENYQSGKADLATVMLQRSQSLCQKGGTTALVTPQNWITLATYKKLRSWLLHGSTLSLLAQLGPAAFQDMNWWGANTLLSIVSAVAPDEEAVFAGLEVSGPRNPTEKAALIRSRALSVFSQSAQQKNPDCRIILEDIRGQTMMSECADFGKGSVSGDGPHYVRCFWEFDSFPKGVRYWLNSPDGTQYWGGREHVILWEVPGHNLSQEYGLAVRGQRVWGKPGVAIAKMNHLHCTLYKGELFDDNLAVLSPHDESDLPALWHFCSSDQFKQIVRLVEPKMSVTTGTFVKIPFDVAAWRTIAASENGGQLPIARSNDPTQWLFRGNIATATDQLQVAIARLLGYRWPEQPKETDAVEALVDSDSIVCFPGVRGEAPAAERVLEMLRAGYGQGWSDAVLTNLLTASGCKAGSTIDDWLRNLFFELHCRRFQHRPFIWHVWDGRKDGFSALVNYHNLNHKTLENLAYSYLGDWITAQTADAKAGKAGADLRLKAAQDLQEKLKAILAGEPTYDIFARWKPLHEQPIGWNPDLNDGVRVNIRPFVEAGILRKNPNIKWTKDRGKEPEREKDDYPWFWSGSTFTGERVNDIHLTNAVKIAARARQKGAS
jgi:hypothetical protein